jgi:hypothetical protein
LSPQPIVKPPSVVRWHVDSQPSGAEVFSVADGRKLGVTPWLREEPMASEQLVIELRKSGFTAKQLTLSKKTDEDRTEALLPRKESRAGAKKSGKKKRTKENSQVDLITD